MEMFNYIPGNVPVLINVPHAGTFVPPRIEGNFTEKAKALPDTDWHVDKLYGFVQDMGVHMLSATHSRYVIDLNRDPNDVSLYPGRFTTGLCPTVMFDKSPIYQRYREPDDIEVEMRKADYWQTYHMQLQKVLKTMVALHDKVVLFDAHSIASQVHLMFDGQLPDLNIGTVDGASIDSHITDAVMKVCEQSDYSAVLNGRFKGGYITRHYGKVDQSIQTIQMELAQINYMDEHAPYHYNEDKAQKLQTVLKAVLEAIIKSVS